MDFSSIVFGYWHNETEFFIFHIQSSEGFLALQSKVPPPHLSAPQKSPIVENFLLLFNKKKFKFYEKIFFNLVSQNVRAQHHLLCPLTTALLIIPCLSYLPWIIIDLFLGTIAIGLESWFRESSWLTSTNSKNKLE